MNSIFRTLHAALLAAVPAAAFAVSPGIAPTDGAVIHPTTGQEITAWKLVGKAVCTAVQIHPMWYLNSAHCSADKKQVLFWNHLAPAGATTQECWVPTEFGFNGHGERNDISLCRLSAPLNAGAVFPPLAAAPVEIQSLANSSNSLQNSLARTQLRPYMAKWGHVVGYGTGGTTPTLAIADFSGMPPQATPATGFSPAGVPLNINGDSGGALFWLPADGREPALMGILTSAYPMAIGTSYLTEQTIGWIQEKLTAAGDTGLRTWAADPVFSTTSGRAVQELERSPIIRSVDGISRSNFTVSWETPTNSASIDGFTVSLGNSEGTEERAFYVAQGQGNKGTLSGILSGKKMVCVRAQGASGSALAGYPSGITPLKPPTTIEIPNCVSFDTTSPTGADSNLTYAIVASSATQRRLTFTWQTTASSSSVHRVEQAVTYAPGITRNSVTELTGLSYSVSVAKGTKVCVKVTPLNEIGILGAATATCVTPQ